MYNLMDHPVKLEKYIAYWFWPEGQQVGGQRRAAHFLQRDLGRRRHDFSPSEPSGGFLLRFCSSLIRGCSLLFCNGFCMRLPYCLCCTLFGWHFRIRTSSFNFKQCPKTALRLRLRWARQFPFVCKSGTYLITYQELVVALFVHVRISSKKSISPVRWLRDWFPGMGKILSRSILDKIQKINPLVSWR